MNVRSRSSGAAAVRLTASSGHATEKINKALDFIYLFYSIFYFISHFNVSKFFSLWLVLFHRYETRLHRHR